MIEAAIQVCPVLQVAGPTEGVSLMSEAAGGQELLGRADGVQVGTPLPSHQVVVTVTGTPESATPGGSRSYQDP